MLSPKINMNMNNRIISHLVEMKRASFLTKVLMGKLVYRNLEIVMNVMDIQKVMHYNIFLSCLFKKHEVFTQYT